MQARKRSAVVAIVCALVKGIGAQQNITPATCADPDGFTSCSQQAEDLSNTCYAQAGSDAGSQAVCACKLDLAVITCALESCWNVVYGCQYQSLAGGWDGFCVETLGDIPFFPAPENAPGGCTCNIGQIVGNFTEVRNYYTSCVQAGNNMFACGCCGLGGEMTSVYSLCPDDDPSVLGLSGVETIISAQDFNPSACAPYFEQYDCVNDLGFPAIGNLPYLQAVPSTTGTLTPSTTGGSITAPLYGSSYVFTADGSAITIVPSGAATARKSGAVGSSPQSSSGTRLTSSTYGILGLHVLVVYVAIHLT